MKTLRDVHDLVDWCFNELITKIAVEDLEYRQAIVEASIVNDVDDYEEYVTILVSNFIWIYTLLGEKYNMGENMNYAFEDLKNWYELGEVDYE